MSRVLYSPEGERLSFIYSMSYPIALAFYPPSHSSRETRADGPQSMVYANLQPPDGTADMSPCRW